MINNFIEGFVKSPVGDIPKVRTKLTTRDYLATIMVRWSINRNNYKVDPGIYAVGSPNENSDVFASANYKLSFDTLRKNLDGLNAWILVLDTKGINVWCAAGKGTFGTRELVNRIKATSLERIINHRKIIVPQLGAAGVSVHQVKTETQNIPVTKATTAPTTHDFSDLKKEAQQLRTNKGFDVIYGPVRASDIQDFLKQGYKTTEEMRKVNFTLADRLKLIPVDFIGSKYFFLAAGALVFILSGLNKSGISPYELFVKNGLSALLNIFWAYVSGIVFTPILLPYIPARSFAAKGFITGIAISIILFLFHRLGRNYIEITSWFIIISVLSSFLAMNFTGSSTYTSLSGVKKEMKIAIPIQISFTVIGLVLFVLGKL